MYDYINQVPFVISGHKNLELGKIINAEVRNLDVFPTLCELFDLDVHEIPWHGESFLGRIQNGDHPEIRMYMEARGGAQAIHAFYIRGVRAGRHKLAYAPLDQAGPVELYDLEADPKETINLYGQNKELAQKLKNEGEAMAQAFKSEYVGCDISPEEQAATIEKLKSLGYM